MGLKYIWLHMSLMTYRQLNFVFQRDIIIRPYMDIIIRTYVEDHNTLVLSFHTAGKKARFVLFRENVVRVFTWSKIILDLVFSLVVHHPFSRQSLKLRSLLLSAGRGLTSLDGLRFLWKVWRSLYVDESPVKNTLTVCFLFFQEIRS